MAKEKTIRVDITSALNHYRNRTGKTITSADLGKVVFKGEKIKADSTVQSMLSGWNTGSYAFKKCTVIHLVRICKYTGISFDDLIVH